MIDLPLPLRVAEHASLRGEDELGAAVLERAADERLVRAEAVQRGGVDVAIAQIEGAPAHRAAAPGSGGVPWACDRLMQPTPIAETSNGPILRVFTNSTAYRTSAPPGIAAPSLHTASGGNTDSFG